MKEKIGPTGKFPHGKVADDDEGEIRIAVGAKDGTVFMNFGVPVLWIGLSPEDAVNVGEALIKHGRSIQGEENARA